MFYISGTKIYLATFDAELKVYPEVKLAWIDYDRIGVVKTGGGVSVKPEQYNLCTLSEVLAQFSGTVASVAKTLESEDEDEE